MESAKMIVECKNVSKAYHKKVVLKPTDLRIPKGECVVICGGNGAGKSTLIRLITGIEKPTTGTIQFYTKGKKPFGFMPDHMNFPIELTPYEILQYYAGFIGVDHKKIVEVIERVGLWDSRNQKIGTFSKGMMQRVSLAQALLSETNLYILDEPNNGLDPYWVIQLKQIISDLRAEGKTILLTSHIMQDVSEIADRVILLFDGEIKANNKLEYIFDEYQCQTMDEVFLSFIKHVN